MKSIEKILLQRKDKISGLIGIATSRTEYLNGCVQYAVMPKIKKGATEIPHWNIDEGQLETIKTKKPIKVKKKKIGGPMIKLS